VAPQFLLGALSFVDVSKSSALIPGCASSGRLDLRRSALQVVICHLLLPLRCLGATPWSVRRLHERDRCRRLLALQSEGPVDHGGRSLRTQL